MKEARAAKLPAKVAGWQWLIRLAVSRDRLHEDKPVFLWRVFL
jgi:hypothetical protein